MMAKRRLSEGGLIEGSFERDLNGLAADGDVDLDLGIPEVHLVTAAVAAADDREAHLGPSLDVGDSSHSFSFDQRRIDWPPRTAIPIALRWPTITTSRLPRVTPV